MPIKYQKVKSLNKPEKVTLPYNNGESNSNSTFDHESQSLSDNYRPD